MTTSDTDQPESQPAPIRYRAGWRAALHYLLWSGLLILLWPLSLAIRAVERVVRHD